MLKKALFFLISVSLVGITNTLFADIFSLSRPGDYAKDFNPNLTDRLSSVTARHQNSPPNPEKPADPHSIAISRGTAAKQTAEIETDYLMREILYQESQIDTWADQWFETTTYDENGNLSTERRVWYLQDPLILDWDHTFTYDDNGNLVERFTQVRIWPDDFWQDWELWIYSYDNNGNLISILVQIWVGYWLDWDLFSYTYDDNGNLTGELWQGWIPDLQTWRNAQLWTYTYNEIDQQETKLYQRWLSGAWGNTELNTYTYDNDNNLSEWLRQSWQDDNWLNFRLIIYTYNDNGNLTEWLTRGWEDGQQVNISLNSYTYNENEYLDEWLYQVWENESWRNYFLVSHTYDGAGLPVEMLRQFWQDAWRNYGRRLYTYYYDPTKIDDEKPEGELNIGEFDISNYPNPFKSTTNIRFTLRSEQNVSLQICNTAGQLVRTLAGSRYPAGEHTFTWDGRNEHGQPVGSGVYLYRLQAGTPGDVKGETKRMILMK